MRRVRLFLEIMTSKRSTSPMVLAHFRQIHEKRAKTLLRAENRQKFRTRENMQRLEQKNVGMIKTCRKPGARLQGFKWRGEESEGK